MVVEQIKKVFSSKKGDSLQKLKALTLLHFCIIEGKNPELVMYAEKKLLNKLQALARFKKVFAVLFEMTQLRRNHRTLTEGHCFSVKIAIRISPHCS